MSGTLHYSDLYSRENAPDQGIGISLFSIVGKVFVRVILIRLQKLAERVYPESQCGLRHETSTVDMEFSLRQIQ